jgi:hypothetical protein
MNNIQKALILSFIILLLPSVFSVKTCILDNGNLTQCFDTDMNIYETGITFYEGQNDKYGVYIENPETKNQILSGADLFIKNVNTRNIINPNDFNDKTTLTFNRVEDFNNLLQKKNADCNVSLFTQSDLYAKERLLTKQLSSETINWTYILLMMIMEFIKIVINILLILLTIFIIFRGIPMGLNFVKRMVIKFYVWSRK